jgi:hypothetical protein
LYRQKAGIMVFYKTMRREIKQFDQQAAIYAAGNQFPDFTVARWGADNGYQAEQPLHLPHLTNENANTYYQALRGLSSPEGTAQITDGGTGKVFKQRYANLEAATNEGVDIEFGANDYLGLVRFAANAALNPNRRRILISNIPLSDNESAYITRTGRYTDGEGRALPVVQALRRVLSLPEQGNRLTADPEHGGPATALMQVLPAGAVSHALFDNRLNICRHDDTRTWTRDVVRQVMRDDPKYFDASRDDYKLNSHMLRMAATELQPGKDDDLQPLPRRNSIARRRRLAELQSALLLHASAGEPDPTASPKASHVSSALLDTYNAGLQQPDARLTYRFSLDDKLHGSRQDLQRFMQQLGSLLPGLAPPEAILTRGSHRDVRAYPSLGWTLENYAFGRPQAGATAESRPEVACNRQ